MRKAGYRESTVRSSVKALKAVARRANLLDPESVKAHLATSPLSESRKQTVIDHLDRFYRWKRIPFTRPMYHRIRPLPFIPLESEVDALISGAGAKTAVFLQLMKEAACRPGEAWMLRWIDVDGERSCVRIIPEKDSEARERHISNRLLAMLNALPHKWINVFHASDADPIRSLDDFRRTFINQRRRVAERLQNPRLLQISFKTLRHWKATTEYHKTKDILHVMRMLGHKNIQNTLVYTHLVEFHDDEFLCRIARTVDEARALVESGFDFVSEIDGVQLFKKRK
jgi:integrase